MALIALPLLASRIFEKICKCTDFSKSSLFHARVCLAVNLKI